MFNLISMLEMKNNYHTRRIGRWDSEDKQSGVSTCSVTDGKHTFETAFWHPAYNDGKMVIVEAYDTREEAEKGHEKWLKIMIDGPLPDFLSDCANSEISRLSFSFGNERRFRKAGNAKKV